MRKSASIPAHVVEISRTADTDHAWWELVIVDGSCPACGRMMYICDHQYLRLHIMEGPVNWSASLTIASIQFAQASSKRSAPNWRNY
jgi:hypothetical protein